MPCLKYIAVYPCSPAKILLKYYSKHIEIVEKVSVLLTLNQ